MGEGNTPDELRFTSGHEGPDVVDDGRATVAGGSSPALGLGGRTVPRGLDPSPLDVMVFVIFTAISVKEEGAKEDALFPASGWRADDPQSTREGFFWDEATPGPITTFPFSISPPTLGAEIIPSDSKV